MQSAVTDFTLQQHLLDNSHNNHPWWPFPVILTTWIGHRIGYISCPWGMYWIWASWARRPQAWGWRKFNPYRTFFTAQKSVCQWDSVSWCVTTIYSLAWPYKANQTRFSWPDNWGRHTVSLSPIILGMECLHFMKNMEWNMEWKFVCPEICYVIKGPSMALESVQLNNMHSKQHPCTITSYSTRTYNQVQNWAKYRTVYISALLWHYPMTAWHGPWCLNSVLGYDCRTP